MNGELLITFPIPDRRIDFEIDVVFYRSDGSVVARRTAGGYVNERWGRGSDYWVVSAGSGQPSRWKAGLYRVDLSVDGKLIASEEFEIVDREIPTSGPFLELREGLPWAKQPLGLDEENALLALSSMMETDPALAAQVASLPWVRQDLTIESRNALQAMDILATANVDLAKRVAGSSWLADGVTKGGWLSLRTMASLAATDEEIVNLVAGLPWLANDEGLTVSYVLKILGESPAVAETLLGLPWLADGITDMEAVALKYLSQISGRNADAAAAIIAMPFLKTLEGRDTLALRSLDDVARQDPYGFKEVLSYPRIKGGITDEDTKIVAVIGGCTSGWAPESTQVLLAETGVYIEERVIELPHTGETLLAIIRTQDRVSQSMDLLEHTSRTIERFMGEPYPTNYLVVLYYDHPAINNACGRDTHLLFHADDDAVAGGPQWHAGVLAHETAHRYWIHDWEDWPYQWWITEGVAEFFKAYSEHERIGRPLEPTSRPCGFFDNIRELEEARPDTKFIPGKLTPRECFYSLGERFFLDLYLALGDETFRAGLHTFYERYWPLYLNTYIQDNPADGCGRPPLNICRVEAAFKDGASPEVVAKVDEVINRWYYGIESTTSVSLANLEHGAWLEENKPASADRIKALPWVADGVAESEREAAEQLIRAARWYPDTFNVLMAMSWVQDTITTAETRAIYGIRGTTRLNPELAKKILQKPWVQDDITRDEGIIIRRLYWLARRTDEATQQNMVDFAIHLVDMPFLVDVTFAEARAVMSLYYLAGSRYRDSFQAIMSHPKVQDGITDQEAKVIAVLRTSAHYKPEMIPHLLDGLDGTGGVYLEERIIQLPLTGETLLTIVRTQNQTTASMGYLEHAVRFSEKFMASPLPTNYVALYFGAVGTGLAANNWYTHMAMASDRDGPERKANVFAHEVGHYYFRSPGPRWIHEGAAEIIAFVSEYERAGYPLETHLNTPCDHIKTLPASDPDEHKLCAYYLGGAFFIDLYRTLGEDAFLQGFRALHRMSWVDNPDDDCFECTELNIHYVERAFKDGASPEVVAKVDAVINRWYYGTTPAAEIRLDFPWMADGLTEDEQRAIRYLREILEEDRAIAATLLGFPWLADGVTEDESRAVQDLRLTLREDPTVARTLLTFDWLADGVTNDERYAIYFLRTILRTEPAMAKVVLGSPWFSDGVTRTERQTLWGLRNLYDLDHSSISTLTAKPWFKDGLSDEEFMLVGDLGQIARRSEAHFLAIIGMPFLETFEPVDALAARGLRWLAGGDDGGSKEFRRVMAHPTISDGISDEETAIVATLNDASDFNPDIFDALLDPDTVTLEERTIDLPHTGEMQLTIIRIRPGAKRTMDLLERAVRTVESFAAMPFPVRHIIFLAENTTPSRVSIDLTHISGEHELFDTHEYPEVRALHVLAHEASHYYWNREWSRHWIEDGLGAFMQGFIMRQAKVGLDVPVVPIWPAKVSPCPIAGNIAELERLERQHGIKTDCSDALGERLFQDLWRTLGDSDFRQGLGNLYLMARSGSPVGGCGYAKAGMCKVAAAFKAAAPADAASIVDKVLARWYYNSEPYDNSHVDASQPNPKLPGGVEITRAYISLDGDRPEETRTGRFSASEIQERVYLSLHLSFPAVQQARELPLTVVEYFEDGFPYRVMDRTPTLHTGRTQSTSSYSVGPHTPGDSWIVKDTPDRTRIVWGNVEAPPTWAAGRYWVQVYHGEQKVAEVEFQVTP